MKTGNTIEVQATGKASGAYDLAHFSLVIFDNADTGPEAKEKIRQTSDLVLGYIASLEAEGTAHNVVVAFSIAPYVKYNGHANVHAGYTASNRIDFSSKSMPLISSIQEKLTTFVQTRVSAVTYTFSDYERMRELAVADAYEMVWRRFEHQRAVLNLSERRFRVVSWSVDEPLNHISKVSRPTDDDEGTASVSVSLSVFYEFED